ncbi:MAG: hypothetical protein Q9170_003971 [Blastenia crenularia]
MMLPPPVPSTRLHANQSPVTADELVFQANALLSSGQSRKAVELYTEVLYEAAPGHIFAFLNRSMAYILEDRPELAVTDAYRALGAIENAASSVGPKRHSADKEIKGYLKAEGTRIFHKLDWTIDDARFIPTSDKDGFAKQPLASLVMDMDDADCPIWHDPGMPLEDMCSRLLLRAQYRLCGSLFKCRAGAAQDALGMISDLLVEHKMFQSEEQCFKDLGAQILNAMTCAVDLFRQTGKKTDDEHIVIMPTDDSMISCTKPESMLKTHVTQVPAVQYWDDTHEPNFAKSDSHRELRDFTAVFSSNCMPTVLDLSRIGLLPHIEMRACKDLMPGDTIFSERCPWRVTTSTPEKVLDSLTENDILPDHLRLYCDSCATALLLPPELVNNVVLLSFDDCPDAEAMKDPKVPSGDPKLETDSGQRRLTWSASTHVTFCSNQHEVPYCSKVCRRLRRHFDPGIHESRLEFQIRNEKIPTPTMPRPNLADGHPHSLYSHTKTQTLYDLLFLRIYASALNQDVHPLELVKFLRGNLSPPVAQTSNQSDSKTPMKTPWSFYNNVRRPIWCINRYHETLGQDPLRFLRRSDGWVINTLLAKIHCSSEIVRGALSAVIYDMGTELKTWCHRGLEPWVGDHAEAVYSSEDEFNDVWVARLDPLVSMIRIANEAMGEKPNCWLRFEEGVEVIAGQPDDPRDKKGAAVKQGEMLLRAKPKFLGGSPYDVTPWDQRDPRSPTSAIRKNKPTEQSTVSDEKMTGVSYEIAESPQSDEAVAAESDNDSFPSVGSSDEEMLEILDKDSPEAEAPASSPKSPPTEGQSVSTLDGQSESAEDVHKRSSLEEEDGDNSGQRHKHKKRRLSDLSSTKCAKNPWSRYPRVRKRAAYRPPRNSLFDTARMADILPPPPPSPRPSPQKAVPSVPFDDDGFLDGPVGSVLCSFTEYLGDAGKEFASGAGSVAMERAPRKALETRSITDQRKRAPLYDPGEGSSKDVKAKGVIRGRPSKKRWSPPLDPWEESSKDGGRRNVNWRVSPNEVWEEYLADRDRQSPSPGPEKESMKDVKGKGVIRPPEALEMRSTTDPHEPDEGSMKDIKGKGVLRGGAALRRTTGKGLKKKKQIHDWIIGDNEGDWMDLE